MSTAKRSRGRQPEADPPSKRLKTAVHAPAKTGLRFLTDEDARAGRKLSAKLSNGVPEARATVVDESKTTVAKDAVEDDQDIGVAVNGVETDEDESTSESSSGEDESDADEVEEPSTQISGKDAANALTNGHVSPQTSDAEQTREPATSAAVAQGDDTSIADDQPEAQQQDVQDEEPSFGDMLQARHPDPIDVQSSFPNPLTDARALAPASGDRTLVAPTGTSLGTVLTQALKTNDRELLESCFRSTDLPSIRATIQRLPSQHVATLLQRVAERIYKRPGRTGPLMVWVQWSLVAHGGYIANSPEIMKRLRSLSQVVSERASGLQPMLHLKGKLDMLSAQLELRRSMQAANRALNAEDEDDEEGVVYVEGQNDDDWSVSDDEEEEEEDEEETEQRMIEDAPLESSKPQMLTPRTDDSESEDFANGAVQEANSDESQDEAEDGVLDIEAEETSDDDDDEEDDGESDEEASSAAESEDNDDDEDDDSSEAESEALIEAPNPRALNRKR